MTMDDCLTQSKTQTVTEAEAWGIGLLAPEGTVMAAPCLRHCLGHDTAKGRTHGCAMLRDLLAATDADETTSDAIDVPDVCEQGYAVRLVTPAKAGEPFVLVLRPDNDDPGEDVPAAALDLVRSVGTENWQLQQENRGLAEEVLRSYEQINFIFDLSAQIAILGEPEEVLRMLLTRLREMFRADSVFLIQPDRQTAIEVDADGSVNYGYIPGGDRNGGFEPDIKGSTRPGSTSPTTIALPPEYVEALERFEISQRVFVSLSPEATCEAGHGTTLWGVLSNETDTRSVVGIVRRAEHFASGDMLLLDSALTYGGHVLRNLELVEKIKRTGFEVVRTMVNAIDQKDNYTCGHSERVGFLARAVGQRMGMASGRLQELEFAGLLHDVGKIGIPEHVLNKEGPLTDEEYEIIKGHPSRGDEILKPVASLEPVLEGILYHHENPDGTGYPKGLKADEIPLVAAIIHVVDVFDALTSTRSYRQAYDPERAMAILREGAGTKFDADIVSHLEVTWAQLPVTHPAEYARWYAAGQEWQI